MICNVNECKPLPPFPPNPPLPPLPPPPPPPLPNSEWRVAARQSEASRSGTPHTRGLHSSTFQLNISAFC